MDSVKFTANCGLCNVLQQTMVYFLYYSKFWTTWRITAKYGLCDVWKIYVIVLQYNYGLGNVSHHSMECVKYYRNYYCVLYYSKLLHLWCRRVKYGLYKVLYMNKTLDYWMHNNTLKNVLCITEKLLSI